MAALLVRFTSEDSEHTDYDWAEDFVAPGLECPNCGENRMDWLVWQDDGEDVVCTTCGTVYTPPFYGMTTCPQQQHTITASGKDRRSGCDGGQVS